VEERAMEHSKTESLEPYILLSWPIGVDYIPPPVFSSRQVTLCPEGKAKGWGFNFSSIPEGLVECPPGDFDLYEFVQRTDQIENKEFDLVIIWTASIEHSNPLNTKKFGCPTVLLAGDTHHHEFPITHLLTYWATEGFDYVATSYNRPHLHWFAAAGARDLAWLPLISMRTVTHDWSATRESRVVFIGQLNSISMPSRSLFLRTTLHPRRCRLAQLLRKANLPFLAQTANREEAARLFATSLISFNCSANADLNLRNLEVISAGGFLLTDRLSFASGFDELLVPGTYCDTYDSEGELLEKVRYYLDHPQEAIEIARRAYHTFDEQWHPRHRIQNLLDWVFGGELPEPFRYSPRSEVRHFVSTANSHLIDTRLAVYEPVQELHRVQERLKVFVGRNCPGVIAADLLDLPRLELYVEGSFVDPCALLDQRGVAERVHELRGETASWPVFDVAVCTVEDLKRLKQPLKASFAFVLGENPQLLFTEASRLMETRKLRFTINQFKCAIRLYEETFFYGAAYLNFPSFVSDISEVKAVVDVGSGVGLASVCFRGFCPDAVIHCFEVDPLALHLLQQNALSLGNCRVHPVGLAGQNSLRTRRLWPEDSQTEWGVEQVLVFREAKAALQELGLERIDVLRVATGGQEVEVLASLEPWLKDIKVIYVEFGSEQGRKQIDQVLDPSHMIWQGEIIAGQRGSLCYLRRA